MAIAVLIRKGDSLKAASGMNYPNLLIISANGRKSGKTTMACRIIEHFRHLRPVAVKISPHFHTRSPELLTIEQGPGFGIYEETNAESGKDTSRMLKSGAAKAFLILVWDTDLEKVFKKLIDMIPGNTPVVCESPALRKYFEPGAFIIMIAESPDRPEVMELKKFPHLEMKLEDIAEKKIPVQFVNGRWK